MKKGIIASELSALIEKISKDVAVVVEGKKDKAALEQLCISNKIYVLNKKPLFAVAEEIAASHKDAIILTDLDGEGKKLYGKLNALLQQLGVKVDNNIRNFLFKNTKLRQIEGITKLIQRE
ncbi:MAG TPA: toprim domain-containing protein [Candidatus Nanoarchaeia archaeon]|nr:toprim domain-containing protein [Candidatus Nanoarchaeia archaeon]